MNKYIIIMFSDHGKTIAKRVRFYGSYREACVEAAIILHSSDRYTSYKVEIDF